MFQKIDVVSAAIAAFVVAVVMGLGGGAMATQSIDPCYKLCYMKNASESAEEKRECSRACKATPRYICDSKCFKKYAGQKLKDCRWKCVSLQ